MAKKKQETEQQPSLALQGGSNLTAIKKSAAEIWQKYQKLVEDRQSINDQLASWRAELVAMGIPRSSFQEVARRSKLDAEQRREHDFGVQVFGEAVGYKFDLFESADERSENNPRSNPDRGGAKPRTKQSRSLEGLADAIAEADMKAEEEEGFSPADVPGTSIN
jgi:hypothetical protein